MTEHCPFYSPDKTLDYYTHGISDGGKRLDGMAGIGLDAPGVCEQDPTGQIIESQRKGFCLLVAKCANCELFPENVDIVALAEQRNAEEAYRKSVIESAQSALSQNDAFGQEILGAMPGVRQAIIASAGFGEVTPEEANTAFNTVGDLEDVIMRLGKLIDKNK